MTQIHPSWLSTQPTVGIHPSWLDQPETEVAPSGIHRSWLGEAFTGLQRGMISGPGQILSAARAGAEAVGLGGVANAIAPYERGVSTLTDVVKDFMLPRSERTGLWDARGMAGDIGEAIPQLSSAIGAGMIPGVGIAAFAGSAAMPVVGQTYQDAMKAHGDSDRATTEAVANGVVTTVTSMIPGVAILRKVPGGQQVIAGATRRVLGRVGLAALAEGGQETAEQVGQAFAEEMVRNDRALTPALARELLTSPERLNEYLYAGTLGAGLGGAARGAVEAPRIAQAASASQPTRRPSQTRQRNLSDPAALEAWVAANPDKAMELTGSSRAEFDRLGVPGRYEAAERAQIVEDVRILSSRPQTEAAQSDAVKNAFAPPANHNPTPTGPAGGPPQPSPVAGQSPFPDGTSLSRHQAIAQMGKDFDVAAMRRGRIGTTGAAAAYKSKPHVIRFRSRYGGDLGVAAHEIAHHLANTTDILKSAPTAAQAEVAQNDYDQKRLDPEEGFAEYFRYLIAGDDAPTRAPQFHQHVMAWLAANPEAARNVGRARAMIDQVRSQTASQQAEAQQSITGRPSQAIMSLTERAGQAIGRPLRNLYRAMVGPVDAVREMENASGIKFGEDEASPSEQMLYLNMLAGKMTREGVSGDGIYSIVSGEKIGEPMRAALSELDESEVEDFGAYWHAVQALEIHARNRGPWQNKPDVHPAMSEDVANGKVNAVRADPARFQRFNRTQQRMTAFANNVLKVMLEVGNITQADYDNLVNTWTQYAPIIAARDARAFHGMAKRSIDGRNPLVRRKGGDYEVVNPVLAMMAKVSQSYSHAVQQQSVNALVNLHDRSDFKGMGDFIEELPSDTTPNPAEGIFRHVGPSRVPAKTGVNETRVFQIKEGVYDSLRWVANMGLPVSALEKVLDWLRFDKVNKLVRAGATRYNPAFILSNIVRDVGVSTVQTENGAIAAATGLPNAVARLAIHHIAAMTGRSHDQMVALYERTGGNTSGFMRQGTEEALGTIRKVMKDSGHRKALRIAGWVGMSPIKAITTLTDGLETVPRFNEYVRTMQRLGHTNETIAAGKPVPYAHRVRAANSAKDVTTDFSRGGLLGRRINRYVPFFTATLLGTDKFFRTAIKHPGRTAVRLTPIIIATILLWAMKRDDDEYEEQPDWLKYGFWSFDADGDGRTDVRIPRPHDWGWVFFATIEATLDAIYREDPKIITDYLGAFLARAKPNLVPAPIKAGTEVYFNWDSFRNRPILDEGMLRFEAEDQYGPETTGLMREVGKFLNQSPAMMEHFVDGITGGGYSRYVDFVETFDIGKFTLSGVTIRNDYTETIGDFYEKADSANQAFQSSRIVPGSRELSEGDRALSDEAYRINWYAGLMADLRRLVPPDAERNDRFTINRYINGVARHALDREAMDLYPSPFGATDAPDSVKAIVGDHMRRLRERVSQNARTPSSIQSRRRAIELLRDIR